MQLRNQLMNRCIELVQDFRRIVVASGIALPAVRGVARVVRISGSDQSGSYNPVDLLCGVGGPDVMIGGVQIPVQDDDKDRVRILASALRNMFALTRWPALPSHSFSARLV